MAGACTACQHSLPDDAVFCPKCGAPTPTGERAIDDGRYEKPDESEAFDRLVREALKPDFRIEGVIGQGGFGRVYAATDARLGRSLAIKVIRPDLAGATAFIDRFRREATALAKFRHPGIVPIYEIGERSGLIYYLMPRIEGETLRAKLTQHGRLAPKEANRILMELCGSLTQSHRVGIVHRDIKPDNIMLEGFLGKVLLMDFGIAKAVEDASLTNSGVLLGTPIYMSPEQASGDPMVDARSDIYSVGALGYHMLTGRPPFTGTSMLHLVAAHQSQAPVAIRDINPSVPRVVADALTRCLAKNPDDRFSSTQELAAELSRAAFLGEDTTAVAPAGPSGAPTAFFAGVAATCVGLTLAGPETREGLDGTVLLATAAGVGILALWFAPAIRPREAGETRLDRLRDLIRGSRS